MSHVNCSNDKIYTCTYIYINMFYTLYFNIYKYRYSFILKYL